MAYMKKDGGAPYPNKAGEYCGNHCPTDQPCIKFHESPEEAKRNQERYLATMRFGRPRPCWAGTTEDMEAMGYVGLYLKHDFPVDLADGDVEIETPDELKEPASASDTKGK